MICCNPMMKNRGKTVYRPQAGQDRYRYLGIAIGIDATDNRTVTMAKAITTTTGDSLPIVMPFPLHNREMVGSCYPVDYFIR